MAYRFLFLWLCFFTAAAFAQKPVFNIRFSEQLAVFVFVQEIHPDRRDNPFKTEFSKSKYNTEKYQKLIAEMDTLAIDYTYHFSEYPYGSKIPGMTTEFLKKNLIATDNLKEFKNRSAGLVTNKPLIRLADIISEFTPIYRELIYEPNKTEFEKQLADIQEYSRAHNISGYFETGLAFYGSSWDSSIPFEVAFYPLPNSEGFTAQAFYNNFVSAVQTDLTDHVSLFSVMLHEIYHIVYDEQPLALKKQLYASFKQNPSKNSAYAYMLLNEVLATALGNGYVMEKLNGTLDEGKWYNWKYINEMAKKSYPLVLKYITEKKAMDKEFVDAYIQLYDDNFPNWSNEMDNIMCFRYMISDNKEDFRTIRQQYKRRSMTEEEDQVTENSIEKMKAVPMTKIIIVSKDHAAKLELIKRKFPELKNWKYKKDKEFTYNILLGDKTQLFIINQINTPTEKLIEKLAVQKQ